MGNRFLKSTGWLLIGNVFKTVFQFAINILIARTLGPENMGKINFVATYTTFFLSIVGLGLDGVIIYELVNHDDHGEIIGTATFMRFTLGVLASVLMIGIVITSENGNRELVLIAILQAIQLPFSAFDTLKYFYQYKLDSKKIVLVNALGYIASSIYKIIVLLTHKSVVWFGLCSSLDVIFIGTFFLLTKNNTGISRYSVSKHTAKRLLKSCIPFLLSNIMALIYSRVDTLMIRYMIGSLKLVGFYTTSIAICGYIGFVPAAIIASARPLIMEAKSAQSQSYQNRMKGLALAIIIINILYSAFITVFGKQIIHILYGDAYLGALRCLRIAVWFTAFSHLGTVKNLWLICEEKNRYVFLFASLGALTNIILNAVMIPVWDIEGAAAATLITQCMTNLIYPSIWYETRGFAKCVGEAVLLKGFNIKQIAGTVLHAMNIIDK